MYNNQSFFIIDDAGEMMIKIEKQYSNNFTLLNEPKKELFNNFTLQNC